MLLDRCPVLYVLSCPVCNVGVLWPNGWTDQDETWHAGRPRPWPQCVRWGLSSPSPKRASPPIFGPYLLQPNGCMDQYATWYGGTPRIRWLQYALDGDPFPPKGGGDSKIFIPHLLWPYGWVHQDGTWHGSRPQPKRFCVRWGPNPHSQKGVEPPSPIFGPLLLRSNRWMHQNATWYGGRLQPRGL